MRWRPFLHERRLVAPQVDTDRADVTIYLFLAAFVALMSYSVGFLAYEEARSSPLPLLQRYVPAGLLLVFFGVMLLMLVLSLFELLFNVPLLDVLLVAPLTGRQIFWEVWRQFFVSSLWGTLFCVPAWAWLFGRSAAGWLYPVAAAIVVLLVLASTLVAALLVLCGRWVIAGVAGIALVASMDVRTLPEPLLAFDGRPVAAVAFLIVFNVVIFAVTDLMARWIYTHERLTRLRDRPVDKNGDDVPPPPRLAAWLFRRLDRETHARWRLMSSDEHPESFVRRLPTLLVASGVAAVIGHGLTRLPWGTEEMGNDVLTLLPFGLAGALGVLLLSHPSVPLRYHFTNASLETAVQDAQYSVPFHEIAPIPVRKRLKQNFLTMTGMWGLIILIPASFAIPLLEHRWLWSGVLASIWIALPLFAGLALVQPGLDPRRDPPRTALNVAQLSAVLLGAAALLWLYLQVIVRTDLYVRIASRSEGLPYTTVLLGGIMVFAVLDVWLARRYLRLHEERWFDVVL